MSSGSNSAVCDQAGPIAQNNKKIFHKLLKKLDNKNVILIQF